MSIRSDIEMSLFVNVSEEDTFRLIVDYFTSKRMRILTLRCGKLARYGSAINLLRPKLSIAFILSTSTLN
jgi:hypothetical protein